MIILAQGRRLTIEVEFSGENGSRGRSIFFELGEMLSWLEIKIFLALGTEL